MQGSMFLDPNEAVAAAHLAPGMLVADFGAGSGFFTRAAARVVGPEGIVWAVDASGELLARTKNLALAEGLHNVEVVRGDFETIGGSHLPTGKFDFAIVANVLFSAHDRVALASEVARVLARGGRALIIDWRDSFDGLGPHPGHVVTAGVARDVFEQVGLVYVGDIRAGRFHWGFIVRKKVQQAAQ